MYRCKETKQELQIELSRLRKRWIASEKEKHRLLMERFELVDLKEKLSNRNKAFFLMAFAFFGLSIFNIIWAIWL